MGLQILEGNFGNSEWKRVDTSENVIQRRIIRKKGTGRIEKLVKSELS